MKRVEERVDDVIARGGFDERHRELLLRTAGQYRPRTRRNPLGDPLAVFYLISRAYRDELDEQAVELGAFCQFYLLALDLLDDVQDRDLRDKPHAAVGPAMALNDGLTLLFLGLSALERSMRLEKSPQRRLPYLKLVNRVALTTGRGQRLDLMGAQGVSSPDEVLDMQRAKTASIALLCECAALYSCVTEDEHAHYRRLGENLSLLVQVLDDLRDVYGKHTSPDLATGKLTFPLACFFESADETQRSRFETYRQNLPASLGSLRGLLYESGALHRAALTIERCRRGVHQELSALTTEAASHRVLLMVVDQLVEAVYTPKALPLSEALRRPDFGYHALVRRLANEQSKRLAVHGLPPAPPLVPWHRAEWMYSPSRRTIFYPDVEGLPEETLPQLATLLGDSDLNRVRDVAIEQAPAALAHELFHYYRDRAGRLSSDVWHEEWVANTLAVAYCARHAPGALSSGLRLAEHALSGPALAMSERARAVLTDVLDPARVVREAPGYGLDSQESALVHLAMIRELAREPPELAPAIERWLGSMAYANAS